MTPSPVGVLSVPQRSGDFSADSFNLIDPITGADYPNNQVPVNPVIANYIAKYMPMPDRGDGPNTFIIVHPLAAINDDQGVAHFDYNVTPRDTISLVYLIDDSRAFLSRRRRHHLFDYGAQPIGSGGDVPIGSGGLETQRNQIGTFTWTHTFSSTRINEFRFGASRYAQTQGVPTDTTSPAALGFTNVTPADPAAPAPPTIFGPSFTLGPSIQGPTTLHRASFEWSDNFTWTRGKHEIKFGGDITRIRNNFDYLYYNNGGFDFTCRSIYRRRIC